MISMFVGFLESQLGTIVQVFPAVATLRLEKKKIQNEAVGSMRKAFNKTWSFLKKPDFTDEKKLEEISDLWNIASEKVGILNPSLGRMLGDKSRFWGDRDLFISLGRDSEIISLDNVISEIERIYVTMK